MLSDNIVENFPGKLWCCTATSCTTKGMMKGFTVRSNFANAKKHKKTPLCKLFLPDVLHDGKKSFGKNMDHSTDPNYVYGRPTEFRTARQKKAAVEETEACEICQTTEHRCSNCQNRCCNFCRGSGENHNLLCKTCSKLLEPSLR